MDLSNFDKVHVIENIKLGESIGAAIWNIFHRIALKRHFEKSHKVAVAFAHLATLTFFHLSFLPVCLPFHKDFSIPSGKHFCNFVVTSIFEPALLLEIFAKLVNGKKPSTIFTKNSIMDV